MEGSAILCRYFGVFMILEKIFGFWFNFAPIKEKLIID